MKIKKIQWNTLFSSIGTTVPIGNFFNLSFSNWKKSIYTNFISQLNVLHELFPLRKKTMTNVIFWLVEVQIILLQIILHTVFKNCFN